MSLKIRPRPVRRNLSAEAHRRLEERLSEQQSAIDASRAMNDGAMATVVLPRNAPSSASNAPYTLGVKKTKSKVKWGGKPAETASSTYAVVHRISDRTLYQSRWYDKRNRPYVLKVSGSHVYMDYCDQKGGIQYLAQLTEDGLKWLFPLTCETEPLQDRVLSFLGVTSDDPSSAQFVRFRMLETFTDVQKERLHRQGKKEKSRQRPGKKEREAMKKTIKGY